MYYDNKGDNNKYWKLIYDGTCTFKTFENRTYIHAIEGNRRGENERKK